MFFGVFLMDCGECIFYFFCFLAEAGRPRPVRGG